MADTITYFGEPKRATYPDNTSVIVNGRPLLIPENFDLQNEINAAHYAANSPDGASSWFKTHFARGSSGDPQRQAGRSGGFDPRYTDAGNYAFGLSAAAAGYSWITALILATIYNGSWLPAANASAIRKAYSDYTEKRFANPDRDMGADYVRSVKSRDDRNVQDAAEGSSRAADAYRMPKQTDVERYALEKWGTLDSPGAKAFMANFEQAFGSYPQHVDLDKLHALPADGSIPSGKDVSLFVGRNGRSALL
jgi:hypothetical protein